MALPVRQQLTWWGVGASILLLALWVLGDALLPFVVGSAIAYLLDPVADRLERLGCSRFIATSIITVLALAIVIVAAILIVPALTKQFAELVEFVPEAASSFLRFVSLRFPELLSETSFLQDSLSSLGEILRSHGARIVTGVFSSAMTAVNAIVFAIIVPVVMVYMLADWDRIITIIDGWLPKDHADWLRELFREVDSVLAGFVRGQLSVCAILAIYYAVLLLLVGLEFGLIVGVAAGLLSFIPFVGATIGGVLAVGLALFQFWSEPWWIAVVVAIFTSGQILEGNFLTPKLVGKSVGLHPVWLLFALSAFGTLFGFVGMLVAVPAAATIGVFFRFGVRQYLGSRLYLGKEIFRAD